eukprot:SAG31_NODE_50_length_30520_cov_89.906712_12_plen_206_part_00
MRLARSAHSLRHCAAFDIQLAGWTRQRPDQRYDAPVAGAISVRSGDPPPPRRCSCTAPPATHPHPACRRSVASVSKAARADCRCGSSSLLARQLHQHGRYRPPAQWPRHCGRPDSRLLSRSTTGRMARHIARPRWCSQTVVGSKVILLATRALSLAKWCSRCRCHLRPSSASVVSGGCRPPSVALQPDCPPVCLHRLFRTTGQQI